MLFGLTKDESATLALAKEQVKYKYHIEFMIISTYDPNECIKYNLISSPASLRAN